MLGTRRGTGTGTGTGRRGLYGTRGIMMGMWDIFVRRNDNGRKM
jgi:hypothetical protein